MTTTDVVLPEVASCPQTLVITFKDGTVVKMPYFDKESSASFIDNIEDLIRDYSVHPYTGE